MPSLWSGSITFGLVSIPVRLETSQRNKGLSFNMLHDKCQQRVNQKYYCSTCDQYLERHELVRGYEHERDHYVVMDKGDFEKVEGEASRNIEVIAFVSRSELQPAHFKGEFLEKVPLRKARREAAKQRNRGRGGKPAPP